MAGEASGVLPGATKYNPWPKMTPASAAVGAAVKGAFLARASSGQYTTFAATATAIKKYAGATSWTDFSGATYALPADEMWSAAQHGTYVIFANGADGLVYTDVDVGTSFASLAGAPIGRYVKTVGGFLMVGRTSTYPTGLEWSGLNDPTYWTYGNRSADFQNFKDGGFITGITPLEAGLIFQETAIRRFVQVSDVNVFNFAKVEDGQGCVAPNSIATRGTTSFYLGRNGFRRIGPDTGYTSAPIGLEVIDAWFQQNINIQRLYTIQGIADPLKPRMFWLAPSAGNGTDLMDIILCYDDGLKKWTHGTVSSSLLIGAATPGLSLEDLDALYASIDSMTVSMDSPIFMGGVPYVAGFDSDYKMAFFNGSNMAATVQTAEFQPIPGKRAFGRGFRPLTDAANAQGRTATRENLSASATWSTAASMDITGFVPQRVSGRYMRAEVSIAEGETWSHLLGVDVDGADLVPDGVR